MIRRMAGWTVERILHFGQEDFVAGGLAHFGFHARDGRYYAVSHQGHFAALVGADGLPEWTVAPRPVLEGVPNVAAELEFPMYADALPDGSVLVSSFGNARLYRIDPASMRAHVLVDGRALGLVDMGNCVVDDEGTIWVNEVRGCRIRRFDRDGRLLETLGDGVPGFRREPVGFDAVRFGWVYDIRRGRAGTIVVLDSGNFALRIVDVAARVVLPLAGTGRPGYDGDGGPAANATFGGDASAAFDGPISLSLDEDGNVFVGDRFNGVVRMIERESGVISTIAGGGDPEDDAPNDPGERDPRRLRLPMISSMDYAGGRLFVPTDLEDGSGDLAVLRRS
jgi:hypothetical protein